MAILDKRTRYYELCRLLALKAGMCASEKSADRYLQSLYKIILEQLELNGEIVLPKFGRFYIEHVEDKEMISQEHNREKKYIYVPERDDIKFTPYKEFRDAVNKKYKAVKTHAKAKDIPLNATVAELFQRTNERRKD